MCNLRVVVVGVGNMGSVFAARLADAGHEVTLIARNSRLRELQANGLRLRNRFRRETKTYRLTVLPELSSETPADAILVMVQRPQVDALIPALTDHPCRRICFLFNCSEIDPSWQESLGNRLVWGFPAALGGTKSGIVEYVLLPRFLRILQITTVGVASNGNRETARAIVGLLDRAGIATVFHPDMRSWLLSHTALMLPSMSLGHSKFRAARSQSMSLPEAWAVASAQKECFATARAAGATITPLNMRLVATTPRVIVAAVFMLLSRTPAYRRSMLDHVDHARDELTTMYAGIAAHARRHSISTTALDELCAASAGPNQRAEHGVCI